MGVPRYLPDWELPKHPYSPGDGDKPKLILDSEGHKTPDRQFLRGVDLYNHGFFWRAHEAWEELWVESQSASERSALKGLIQCCAALLHANRGRNVDALRQRAVDHLRAGAGHGLGFSSESFADEMEAHLVEPGESAPPVLRSKLEV